MLILNFLNLKFYLKLNHLFHFFVFKMLGTNTLLGSTDQGTSFSDIIITTVNSVTDGQVTGFQAFLHDPKALKETVEQVGKMSIPKRFIEAVTARRIATNSINSVWRCPLNLQTPITTPIPWNIIEAQQNEKTSTGSSEFQIMRTVDFIGRNYIRLELPEVNTQDIGMKAVNGYTPQPLSDPTQTYLGAWHRDLVPRIIDKVSFYPRSSQHKLFTYTGFDIAVHNVIFGNANKEMNDLMAGEDKFELAYDPYRVDGSALGIASFKGIDTYAQFEPTDVVVSTDSLNTERGVKYTGMNGTTTVGEQISGLSGQTDGFVDTFQLNTTMDDEQFKSFYRRNVWYESPVAVPYDCRHSIHSRRIMHRKAVIIIPLDVLPFGYSIESSLPTAAIAGDCGFISIQRYSDWFDRAFYLTRLSDIPSLHPIVQHTHLAEGDYVKGKVYQNGKLVEIVDTLEAGDIQLGWVDERSVGQYGNPDFVRGSLTVEGQKEAKTSDILEEEDTRQYQEGVVVGGQANGLEGVIPTVVQPIKETWNSGTATTGYSEKFIHTGGYGGRIVNKNKTFNLTSTARSTKAANRLDYNTDNYDESQVFLCKPSSIDKTWYNSYLSQISVKLLQVGYVTMPCIKQLLTKLPNIFITTEWADADLPITSQEFTINNDIYIMALLFWFLPEDSNGITSMRVYPHHKIDTEYPIIGGMHLQNEQSQGKLDYSWDMMNLMTPAHMGLNPLMSNMGIISFTPLMKPNTLPYAIYDQNLCGYIKGKFLKGDDNSVYTGHVNMRAGNCKCISIGINGTALVNLSLFRLVF